MFGKKKAPKGPDWNRVLDMSEQFQAQNMELMNEYKDLFEQQYSDQKALQDQLNAIYLPQMQDEAELAQIQRDRYRDQGIPFENEYLDKLTNWDTEERRDERAGEAQAAIGQAADAARESELRRLEGYGIDPSQTRSAALDSSLRLQEAISKAGAGNAERKAVEREGMAMGAEAVNLYRGMPVLSSQALTNALGAGQTSMGNQQALGQFGAQGYGQLGNMLGQGYNMGIQGYQTAGNLHQNQLMAHEMDQKYSPLNALGNLAGAYIGMSTGAGSFNPMKWMSAEGGPIPHYAEGSSVSATGNQASAVPVPMEGQPNTRAAMPRPTSQGIPPENITAQLSPGEFVIPDDVARWEGEKNLQKIINKAREDRVATEQQRNQNQRALGIPA